MPKCTAWRNAKVLFDKLNYIFTCGFVCELVAFELGERGLRQEELGNTVGMKKVTRADIMTQKDIVIEDQILLSQALNVMNSARNGVRVKGW